jgi:N-acetylglucosamine-6-sulfatase
MTTRRLFLAQSAGAALASPATRPNIVFVLMDDLRWDDTGAGGHPWVKTPNIDRVAREGMMFRNTFAATPLCSPNRASCLTGQYAHTHGIIDNTDRSARSRELVTFPRLLHDAGYETAYVGKWHMGVDDNPRPGFDYWFSLKGQGYHIDPDVNENGRNYKLRGYTTDIFNERALGFLKRRRDRPVLLYPAHKAVHPNIFQNADGSIMGGLGEAPAAFPPADRHKHLYSGEPLPRRPNYLKAPAGKPALLRKIGDLPPLSSETATVDEVIRNRLRMISAADDGIGEMFRVLQGSGQLAGTVFVFTSDEGYFYGEHCLSVERRLAYEESIRIPLYIRYPGMIRAGRTDSHLISSVDLAPTFLELAGQPVPGAMEGRSLVPLLRGRGGPWRTSLLIEYFSDKVMPRVLNMGYRAVRTERWKYIHYTDLTEMDELYDLRNDPYELRNLAGEAGGRGALASMRAELNKLLPGRN